MEPLEYSIPNRFRNLAKLSLKVAILFFKGSGRVTFNNHKSYMKAVCAGFIELKTPKFTKKVRKFDYSVTAGSNEDEC